MAVVLTKLLNRSALHADEVPMPALLPISQIACSWSTEELQASAQAPIVEMFCDADLSPLHEDHAADDSSSDVDQVICICAEILRQCWASPLHSWRLVWKKRLRGKMEMMVKAAAVGAAGGPTGIIIPAYHAKK
jgi:hypothetical protein